MLHFVLGRLVRWRPINSPTEGYSLVIGCSSNLGPMLLANLAMLQQQNRTNLKTIVIVVDRPRNQLELDLESICLEKYADLPLQFFYYSRLKRFVAERLKSPFVYAWMSWATGISRVETKHAVLHDFDALLVNPDFLEQRYDLICDLKMDYLGIQKYRWGQIDESLGLTQTFEMYFDCEFVRQRFKAVDLYNHTYRIGDEDVWLDTFLYAQLLDGKRDTRGTRAEDLVHPGQMICQFHDFTTSSTWKPPSKNNLVMIPYYLFLADEPTDLRSLVEQFSAAVESGSTTVQFKGRRLDLVDLDPAHVQKITREAMILERTLAEEPRSIVTSYFENLRSLVEQINTTAGNTN